MKLNEIVTYLLIINVLGYTIMLYDKIMARRGGPRIPEINLLFLAAIGGSGGCLLAMYTIRHKTKHNNFKFGVPAMLVVHVALILYILLF